MPYITQQARARLDTVEEANVPMTIGELNYAITNDCLDYLAVDGTAKYEDYNKIIGVLECVKLEFYRRMVAPYEDEKKEENGDVFP